MVKMEILGVALVRRDRRSTAFGCRGCRIWPLFAA
jgi:hypothetical protein